MSRGPGRLQRQVLEVLGPRRPGETPGTQAQPTKELAGRLFGRPWRAPISPAERASASRALNNLRRQGLVEVRQETRLVRLGRLERRVAVWRLTEAAWRRAEKLRQQQAGAKRRENGRRRREEQERQARAREEAYEELKAELRRSKPRRSTERLARLLGMLGSDYAGERAAAAGKIEEERRRLGLTWQQLLEGLPRS